MITVDANQAVADVAYRLSEIAAIYPITPATPMGEHADAWSAAGRTNLWGDAVRVVELQSEGGAAGTLHGALQAGALATTFTSSQGLLLMIPNMYKIAGELTPCVIHVAARTIATHALSIFGDHSDVYAARATGFAMLAASTVEEAQDLAAIAHATSLSSRLPFLHFFDGFRTSHEIAKIEPIDDEVLRALVDDESIRAHRARALTPDRPVIRGTAHNPDTYFQAREAVSPFYARAPEHVARALARLAELTGRRYGLVDYHGHPEAERVVVVMGSAAETARETARALAARDERVGAITVRLFRPFPAEALAAALPPTARAIAVLDRAKEPGASGEPLYLDVLAALHETLGATGRALPLIIGGRYGLSSKELTPGMIASVFTELERSRPKNHFTLGIDDDVSGSSLAYDDSLSIEPASVNRAVFWGLGADGTVGATKSTVEIIGGDTDLFAQGYFVYDSKKSGTVTVSHLRFGPEPIRAPYLIQRARFVGVHQWSFLERYDVLESAEPGAVVLLNAPCKVHELFAALPREVQEQCIDKELELWAIDAYALARELGLGRRISTIMQACYFALSGVLPREQALAAIREAIARRFDSARVVAMNLAAVDGALERLARVPLPSSATASHDRPALVPASAPEFVQRVTAPLLARHGDALPVSAFPVDGTWPTGTARWEKRNVALEIPVWDDGLCIQCNKCALVCPHAAIRTKVYPSEDLSGAPSGFTSTSFKSKELDAMSYTVQVAPEDCTGCALCAAMCPAVDKQSPDKKALNMQPQAPLRDVERDNFAFFSALPEIDRSRVRPDVKHTQLYEPLFEFSGACTGCGEAPYIKLLTQLFGDRLLVANATGCSSIFGGSLPTTPYTTNADGRGPAWANSLFEDNAEFGLGMRLAVDQLTSEARRLLAELAAPLGESLVAGLLEAAFEGEAAIAAQRARVTELRGRLASIDLGAARRLELLADYLVPKSVWLVGGDGWAYDIGYGGLDHVLASGENVNALVLDTEVYSNTGGQQSKATPLGATAKFATAGKRSPKKDLGLLTIGYGNVYVAQVAFGADDRQTLRAFLEAESYPGPSLIIAYSHCIAHGYELTSALDHQRLAVDSGYWPLYRFDPRRKAPMQLDKKRHDTPLSDFLYTEARFKQLADDEPERAAELLAAAEAQVQARLRRYQDLARD
jgi:pyruvate-ferredoxin/flavodoxin oxidoreductase